MERTKTNVMEEGKVSFKKVGGGSLRLGGKIIKPGQVFTAYPHEIPKSFRDLVIPTGGAVSWKDQDKQTKVETPPPIKGKTPEFTIQPHGKSSLWFDIVDGEGKVWNEKGLKKEVAEKFLANLLEK